jgi:hypothetical protein
MGKADLPKEVMQAVSHEAERRDFLLARNFRHVLPQLFFSLARIPSRSFCLNDCKDGAVRVVEAEIREPIPGRREPRAGFGSGRKGSIPRAQAAG